MHIELIKNEAAEEIIDLNSEEGINRIIFIIEGDCFNDNRGYPSSYFEFKGNYNLEKMKETFDSLSQELADRDKLKNGTEFKFVTQEGIRFNFHKRYGEGCILSYFDSEDDRVFLDKKLSKTYTIYDTNRRVPNGYININRSIDYLKHKNKYIV